MKQYWPFIFYCLILILCWKSVPISDTSKKLINPVIKHDTLPKKTIDSIVLNTAKLRRQNDSLRVVKNKLFQEELKLQDEMAAKKTTVIVKEVPVIIYVPSDSVKKKDALPLNVDHHKKQFFLFRLFHHKKRKK